MILLGRSGNNGHNCQLGIKTAGGRFRAADIHVITGVIPPYYQYDNWFK